MRTTITLADDVAAELQRLRRDRGWGPSQAINELARQGMARRTGKVAPYVPVTAPLGLRADVSDIGTVLGLLDDTEHDDPVEQSGNTTSEQS